MKQNLFILLALACYVLTGCELVFIGAASGTGVYSYMDGQLIRSYQAPFDKTNLACTATLENLKIAITEETSDGIRATIKAKQTDGSPVTVQTVMIDPKITEVSVRSGVVGIWDKKISELIHASIAQRLQK